MTKAKLIVIGDRVKLGGAHKGQSGSVAAVSTDSDGNIGYYVRIDGQTEISGPYFEAKPE